MKTLTAILIFAACAARAETTVTLTNNVPTGQRVASVMVREVGTIASRDDAGQWQHANAGDIIWQDQSGAIIAHCNERSLVATHAELVATAGALGIPWDSTDPERLRTGHPYADHRDEGRGEAA